MDYKGGSNYAVFNTPKGKMAFRLATHNAKGSNFKRDNADINISVYIAKDKYKQPDSLIAFDEYRISVKDFEENKDDFVASLVESVDSALETGIFKQPRHTEKTVDGGVRFRFIGEKGAEGRVPWREGETLADAMSRVRKNRNRLVIEVDKMERRREMGKPIDELAYEDAKAELAQARKELRYMEIGAVGGGKKIKKGILLRNICEKK